MYLPLRHAVFLFAALIVATAGRTAVNDAGPRSPSVDLPAYARVAYVDPVLGRDDGVGDGSLERPWASIQRALDVLGAPGPDQRTALLVTTGIYRQPAFAMKPYVHLYGGFATAGGERDVLRYPTILEPEGGGRIAIGADHARLDGFHLRGGEVRGHGGAILCDGTSPVIANGVFYGNRTLTPLRWNPEYIHETAHDGGALACLNGAAPKIVHCLFYDNETQTGRGGALAADRGSAPVILRSVFVQNRASVEDEHRSGDGGAISFFRWSPGTLRDSVVAGNQALGRNDAGGVFVALWSSARLIGNVIAGNYGDDDGGGIFVGGQEHRYYSPLDPFPSKDRFEVLLSGNVVMGNSHRGSGSSGAMRVTMESRITLENNVIAHNKGGMYLQRSEAVVRNNTVWQDYRFLEDKDTLAPSVWANNILKGPAGPIEARVVLTHNAGDDLPPGAAGIAAPDAFVDDGGTGLLGAAVYDPGAFVTRVRVDGYRGPVDDELTARPVRIGDVWAVIRKARGSEWEIWGRIDGPAAGPEIFVPKKFRPTSDAPYVGAGAGTHMASHDRHGVPRPARAPAIGAYERP